MIQCPKCNFPQPEDIYCANCGVNMSTYTKKQSPWSLLNHWLVQVLIIFMAIVSFVLYDKLFNQKNPPQQPSEVLPVATTTNPDSPESHSDTETSPRATSTPQPQTSPTPAFAKVKRPSPTPQEELSETASSSLQNEAAEPQRQKGLQVSFYRITKQALLELQRRSQAINLSGDSSAGQILKSRFQSLVSSGELQYISGNRYKDFDDQHPSLIFKGQRHAEAARNLGLFVQLTAIKSSESAQLVEVKGWGALKALEPDENFFNGELTLSPASVTYISGFIPRSATYTEDEKQLFEKDRILQVLNDEDFNEGLTDVIMLIEFNKGN